MTVYHISTLIQGMPPTLASRPVVTVTRACECEGCSIGHRICTSRVLACILPRAKIRAVAASDWLVGWAPLLPLMEHGGPILLCMDCGIAYRKRGYQVQLIPEAA